MTRAPMIVALAVPLANCSPGAAPAPTTNTTAAAEDYAARVRALPAAQRDGVLLRAVRDAGRDCQQVTRSQAVGDDDAVPTWAATCDDGGVWVVALNPDGIATVTSARPERGGTN